MTATERGRARLRRTFPAALAPLQPAGAPDGAVIARDLLSAAGVTEEDVYRLVRELGNRTNTAAVDHRRKIRCRVAGVLRELG